MWDIFDTMGTWGKVLVILIIVIAKIVEVSLQTLRQILVVKGYRKISVLFALVEIFLWIAIASRVLTTLEDNLWNGVAYGVGFAAGVYIGSILEEKLAFGLLLVQTITSDTKAIEIADALREKGFGVTTIDAKGIVEKRKILMIYANRRGSGEIIKLILDIDPTAMTVTNDVAKLSGGFVQAKKLFK